MPELPEVQTTTSGLQRILPGLKIIDVWTDLATNHPTRSDYKDTIKYLPFFKKFTDFVVGSKVINAERRAKNILINLSNKKTILVHMKMTGHLLYGMYKYDKKKNSWKASEKGPLQDPFNRFVHLVFKLSNKKYLALSDTRKFAKVTLLDTKTAHETKHLADLGPEPLEKKFTEKIFSERISMRPSGRIKTVLMDQSLIAGIGNIYSDEALWLAGINPETLVKNVKKPEIKKLYVAIKKVLLKGIDFGGDSMSDYRNIDGNPGKFHHTHNAYRKKGERCSRPNCRGVIIRKVVDGRSAHFCSVHQKLH